MINPALVDHLIGVLDRYGPERVKASLDLTDADIEIVRELSQATVVVIVELVPPAAEDYTFPWVNPAAIAEAPHRYTPAYDLRWEAETCLFCNKRATDCFGGR